MKPLSSLVARILLLMACWVALLVQGRAQVESTLHNFADGSVTNDGKNPTPSLVQGTDGNFYGITFSGGSASDGTVFKMTPTGTVTILHSFGDGSVPGDGVNPQAGLVQGTDGNFYGATTDGGSASDGTVFKITPTGTVTILHSFGDGSVANDGMNPEAGLIEGSDGNFYGTTTEGGVDNSSYTLGAGTVFKITPAGAVTILHSFADGSVTNDGEVPQAALIQASDGNFYGTTVSGSDSNGTAFKITPQGTVTILHLFGNGGVPNDGFDPFSGLIQGTDGNFYGTTYIGGSASDGTVFKMTPTGTVTILHSFGDGSVANDGVKPLSGLIQAVDGNFYGTADSGGSASNGGTVFEITPQGTETILHTFEDGSVPNDGGFPDCDLLRDSAGNFYGVAQVGGTGGQGTVFKLTPGLPTITSTPSASGTVGLPFSYQITGTNTPTSFATTTLPGGLSLDPITGVISGAPTTPGTTPVTLTLTNSTGSSNYTLTITIASLPVPSVTSILTAYGTVNVPFTYQTVATNLATSYSATGLTGTGLAIVPTTGIISGTPTSTGTISVGLTATNTTGPSTTVTLSIQIFSTTPTLSQEYNNLYLFGTNNPDGSSPSSLFQAFDGNFYGVTEYGGSSSKGTVFKLTVQGSESLLYSFGASGTIASPTTLIQAADGNFYGTTASENIFKLTPSGQLTALYSFGNVGLNAIIQGADGNFYGTTSTGGSNNLGTVFKITPQGVVTTLHNFGGNSVNVSGTVIPDGQGPNTLIQASDGNFYGTTSQGGSTINTGNDGTIFKLTPQGTETILHSVGDGSVPGEGFDPIGLIQGADGNFYGTINASGSNGVYEITPSGVVRVIGGGPAPSNLIQGLDGNFYGVSDFGGAYGYGDVFQITPQGTVTIIQSFTDPNGYVGANGLIQGSDGNFYGTTLEDGTNERGMVYTIIPSQVATQRPVFTGSAYATSGIYTPLTFTPKAAFGVSGSGVENGNSVQSQPSAGGIEGALVSLLPQTIRKLFSTTNWVLTQGTTPSTMLPNYLTFDQTSGTISGTPETSGTFTFTMTPYNALGAGTAQTVTLYIDVPPGINSVATATSTVGASFNYQIQAIPPADSYGATDLPAWLSVDTVGGVISGTPPAAGSYVFNAVASNVSGQTVQPITLTVTGGSSSVPTITSPKMASGSVGTSFTYQISTSTAATSYSALSLPTGLLFYESTGSITGVPSQTGTFLIPLGAANAIGSYSTVLSLTISPPLPPGIASSLLATAAKNVPFSYQIPATGMVTSYNETGLPMGLMLNTSTGLITGSTSVTGMFPVAITVGNTIGTSMSTLNLNVALPVAFAGTPTATPEKDGVPNLLKYLYDIDQSTPIDAVDRAALPSMGTTMSNGMACLTLNYRQYALKTGVTVNVQMSPDLQNWTTLTNPTIIQTGTDPNTGDPIMQAQVPMNTSSQFIRMNVTSP